MKITAAPQDLPLAQPFVTARGPRHVARTFVVTVEADGVVGRGEGAPIARFGQDRDAAIEAVAQLAADTASEPALAEPPRDLAALEGLLDALAPRFVGAEATLAAIDIALHDWLGRALGVPLWRLLDSAPGAEAPPRVQTSLTISIGEPADMADAAAMAARRFRALKVKLGAPDDEAAIAAVRAACGPDTALLADANEGWRNANEAFERLGLLADNGFTLVEQPLRAGALTAMHWLQYRAPLPVYADEDLVGALTKARLSALCGCFHGFNVKLDKVGGLLPARRWIAAARDHERAVMIGCMTCSSLGIAAAAQLAPLVDHVDLDGALLLAEDPYEGLDVERDELLLSEAPGHGVTPREALRHR